MDRMLRAWAINYRGKISVRNLEFGPRTRLVRGINAISPIPKQSCILISLKFAINRCVPVLLFAFRDFHYSTKIDLPYVAAARLVKLTLECLNVPLLEWANKAPPV